MHIIILRLLSPTPGTVSCRPPAASPTRSACAGWRRPQRSARMARVGLYAGRRMHACTASLSQFPTACRCFESIRMGQGARAMLAWGGAKDIQPIPHWQVVLPVSPSPWHCAGLLDICRLQTGRGMTLSVWYAKGREAAQGAVERGRGSLQSFAWHALRALSEERAILTAVTMFHAHTFLIGKAGKGL